MLLDFLLSCCFTSTEARWPIRDGLLGQLGRPYITVMGDWALKTNHPSNLASWFYLIISQKGLNTSQYGDRS